MSDLRLRDLCEQIVDCKNRTPPEAPPGEEFGFAIGTPNIVNGRILLGDAKPVSKETFDIWTARAVPAEDDIILTREAPVGRVGRIDSEMTICLGQRTMLLRADSSNCDPRFLHYFLLSPAVQAKLHGLSFGSTVPHLRVDQVKDLSLSNVPGLNIQRVIGSILASLDDKIAVNDRIAAASRELGKALYQSALGGLGQQTAVGEISELLTRGQAPRYTNKPTGITVLNQKCVRNGRTLLEPARLTEADRVKPDRILQKYDILVNSTGVGTLGRVGIWSHDVAATADSHVTIIRIAPPLPAIVGGFALLAAQPEVEALGEGSTGQTELSRSKLSSLVVRIPARRVEELARRLSGLEDRADAALSESKSLTEIRDTLLPELMSGRLRVRDAEKVVEEAV